MEDKIQAPIRPVNLRQERFVMEYLSSGNATQAADKAGYKHPNVQSARLLVNISVKEAIRAKRADAMDDLEAKLAGYVAQLEGESTTAKESGTRVRAIELLIKVVGGFAPEKQEVSTYHGGFLADIDLNEDEPDELLVPNLNEINDLH
jgi:hypothetical protein